MLKAYGLTRYYADFAAVKDLTLTVRPGELYGFLGKNGAGKTTALQMMVGLLKPSSGRVEIGGYDVQQQPLEAKRVLGYLAQDPYLYDELTGREFLTFLSGLHQMDGDVARTRIDDLLNMFTLHEKADSPIGSYSGGMRRKVALCGALLHRPRVLILDEPFAGLDPLSTHKVKDVLHGLCEEGITILMSTHTLEIAERVCTRLGIIDAGRLIAEGTLDELRGAQTNSTLEDVFVALAQEEAPA
jgi:ABC-2 type transport system ATP-binding protein